MIELFKFVAAVLVDIWRCVTLQVCASLFYMHTSSVEVLIASSCSQND
jgi:hypothetical protein